MGAASLSTVHLEGKQFWIKSRYLGVTSKSSDRANKCEIAIIDIISESQSTSMQSRYNLCNLFFISSF